MKEIIDSQSALARVKILDGELSELNAAIATSDHLGRSHLLKRRGSLVKEKEDATNLYRKLNLERKQQEHGDWVKKDLEIAKLIANLTETNRTLTHLLQKTFNEVEKIRRQVEFNGRPHYSPLGKP